MIRRLWRNNTGNDIPSIDFCNFHCTQLDRRVDLLSRFRGETGHEVTRIAYTRNYHFTAYLTHPKHNGAPSWHVGKSAQRFIEGFGKPVTCFFSLNVPGISMRIDEESNDLRNIYCSHIQKYIALSLQSNGFAMYLFEDETNLEYIVAAMQ